MVGRRLWKRLASRYFVRTTGRIDDTDIFFDLIVDSEPDIEGSFDVIIHCAASFSGNSVDDMLQNEQVNALGAIRVCRLAERVGCQHILYLSTTSSYDVPENGYFGSYGLSKRHGQENIEFFCRRNGLAFTSLLPTQLYDESGEARKHQPFLYHILDSAAAQRSVCLYGSNDPLRNFLFVEDLVKIIELVIEKRVEGVFSCAHPRSYRLSEIVEMAFAVYGGLAKFEFLPEKPDVPTVYFPREDTLYRALNYFPETDLRAGMEMIRLQQEIEG